MNDDPGEVHDEVQAGKSTWEAIRVIILADLVMSLDNVFALVGASGGNLPLLSSGVAMTILLVIFGSTLLTSLLLDRLPMLVHAGAGLLVYIAVEMFFEDPVLQDYLESLANIERLVGLYFAALFVAVAWLWVRRVGRTP